MKNILPISSKMIKMLNIIHKDKTPRRTKYGAPLVGQQIYICLFNM